ncbi:hypothetical protein CXB51_006143 [Gossypium anomalum]|uniref:Uncharacterized protein n=1 Tax=Gossypium anomalum TaxID=47600 RepID=A0A8J5ZN35_9ROSI|nr:hypothetical protein CXB51_006143 [Gossypium anomalum]
MQLKPNANAKDLARKFSLHTKWRRSDSHFGPMRGPPLLVNDTPMTHEQQPDLTVEGSTRRNLILGISLAPSRGLMDNTFEFPFQLHSQRSEQRPKPIRKAQLYGEDDPGISRGKPFLWCPSSAFQALLKFLTAGILFPFWALSGLG